MIIISFIFFLLVFVAIGVSSVIFQKKSNKDYLLAGSNVKPWLVSLSAVATNNSGYMFVGLIGYTYAAGLQSIWTMIGWILGDFIISGLVHKKLRVQTEETKQLSFNGILAAWNYTNFKYVRLIGGLITLAFLSVYASAQLQAGSKALHALFGWDYAIGAIIGAVMVVAYCFAGGIRASIWTDAAQSFVMFIAMGIMCYLVIDQTGGVSSFVDQLHHVSPTYLDLFPAGLEFGVIPFVIGWLFAGVGVIGQPHVMVRFMTMDCPSNMGRVRAYYYSWYTLFFAMAIICGLAARLLIPIAENFDAELALPSLALELLPAVLVGLVLAGLFAATMSTADSLIISCTAAITKDIAPERYRHSYILTKASTVFVTICALGVALYGPSSVFTLVVLSWAALGAAFGPLLIVYACGGKPNQLLCILMMLGGVAALLAWRWMDYHGDIYEIMPGMLCGLLIYGIGLLAGQTLDSKDAKALPQES